MWESMLEKSGRGSLNHIGLKRVRCYINCCPSTSDSCWNDVGVCFEICLAQPVLWLPLELSLILTFSICRNCRFLGGPAHLIELTSCLWSPCALRPLVTVPRAGYLVMGTNESMQDDILHNHEQNSHKNQTSNESSSP